MRTHSVPKYVRVTRSAFLIQVVGLGQIGKKSFSKTGERLCGENLVHTWSEFRWSIPRNSAEDSLPFITKVGPEKGEQLKENGIGDLGGDRAATLTMNAVDFDRT